MSVSLHSLSMKLSLMFSYRNTFHFLMLNQDFHFIFYCASDWRSALSTETANNIGLLNTSHMLGGFSRWVELNGPIEPPK